MSLTKVTLAGLERFVQPHDLDNYLLHGWQVVNEQQKDLFEQPAQVVDSGAIATKAPKKKKSEKTAETAPEAAQEDLGNAINTGE